MNSLKTDFLISEQTLSEVFKNLKKTYKVSNLFFDKKTQEIINLVKKNGYLPFPHVKALEELTPAQTILALEEKFKLQGVYKNEKFSFTTKTLSPVARAGYTNSSWMAKEQHSIKLINLAALGDGNSTEEPAKFIDMLKQILILPTGNEKTGVLATTAYIIPFHPREFGCAYLPKSSEVSKALCDEFIFQNFELSAKQQIQTLLAFTQLAGHPIIYDVLPQTGRFSKAVLSNPYVARWFDIKVLIDLLENKIKELNFNNEAKDLVINFLKGNHMNVPDHLKEDFHNIKQEIFDYKKQMSKEMTKKENQTKIHQKVKKIVANIKKIDVNQQLTEEDIQNRNDIVFKLIEEGLWPLPGGAWNSCGVPVFDEMAEGASYPMCKHFNIDDEDVTHFANLDCQTPYYFVNLESGEYNEHVIEYYINSLKKLQKDYNFDGFRVDHIDHIVDKVSETNGVPISYRAPRKVLGMANKELKKETPHFATLAEYMLWDKFYKEYNQDMSFDILWGNDIISQAQKNISAIIEDLTEIDEYNVNNKANLSFLKTYNNQDGEFREIDQYPGQLGFHGALFKWFKYKFLVGGKNANRPVLYVDGDESFTKNGIEEVIGNEISMKRANDYEFFAKFNAINKFALSNDFTLFGKSTVLIDEKDGFVVWENKIDNKKESLLVIANEQYPTEKVRDYDENGNLIINIKGGTIVVNKTVELKTPLKAIAEYLYDEEKGEFIETKIEQTSILKFASLKPSEFRIYKITR